VIVLIDANALMSDPMCEGAVWQVLAHAPESWDLRLVISEVALAEAIAGYSRQVEAALDGLTKLTRSWGRLGAKADADRLASEIEGRPAKYREYLLKSLDAVGAEVLPAPAVLHMDVVARSVSRRRPCDKNGDGYRDTLVWLTVLELVGTEPRSSVIFVTGDSDFMDDEKAGLHADLIEDLQRVGAAERVRLMGVLADIPLGLASTADIGSDLRSLRSELRDETVSTYVATLLNDVMETHLDERACGLPRATLLNIVQGIGPIRDFRYEIKGGLSEGQAVAEFTFEADTRLALTLAEGMVLDEGDTVAKVHGFDENIYLITKPLLYQGIARLGRYDKPLDGEISRIAARPDDPGRIEWSARSGATSGRAEIDSLLKGFGTDPFANLRKSGALDPFASLRKSGALDPFASLRRSGALDPFASLRRSGALDPFAKLRKSGALDPFASLRKSGALDPFASLRKSGSPRPKTDQYDDGRDANEETPEETESADTPSTEAPPEDTPPEDADQA
jgi:hypothetical protein